MTVFKMNKEISTIIKYLLNKHNEDHPDKYLKIEIDDENNLNCGNIRIHATGTWIKNFCVKSFVGRFWMQYRKKIFIHIGENTDDSKEYEIYKICDEGQTYLLLDFDEEPFVSNCEYYISFVFDIPKRLLKYKFPVIKKYIRAIAEEYKDIKIEITASDEYWKEDAKINKCIDLICDGLTTVMIYDSTNACRDLMEQHFGVTTKKGVSEKLQELLAQKILKYSQDDLNDFRN